MTKYGVIANRLGLSPFVFCMTESEERAVSLMCHYRIQSPSMIFRVQAIKEDACTGDDLSIAMVGS
jgi:hypothetical protein